MMQTTPYTGLTLLDARRLMESRLAAVTDTREGAAVARIALESVTRYTPVDMALKANEPITDYEASKLEAITLRLLNHEPIQYILGETYWRGLTLDVTPDTLIPRPETAQLVDMIVSENSAPDLNVLDIGTGSGCIAIALSRDLKFPAVTAIDISPASLQVAKTNASRLKAKITLLQSDALSLHPDSLDRRFDIIVSNPPYIAWRERADMEPHVLDYEPSSALFVPDSSPIIFYEAIMRYAAEGGARPGAKIYFEINPLFVDQLRQASGDILPSADTDFTRDMYGNTRFMTIRL